jgi:hypothetical protein
MGRKLHYLLCDLAHKGLISPYILPCQLTSDSDRINDTTPPFVDHFIYARPVPPDQWSLFDLINTVSKTHYLYVLYVTLTRQH